MAKAGFVGLEVETNDGKKVKFEAPVGSSEAEIQLLASKALRKAIPGRRYDTPNIPQSELAKLPQTQDQILARQGNLEAGERSPTEQVGDYIGDWTGNQPLGARAGAFLGDMPITGGLIYGADALARAQRSIDRKDALGALAGIAGAAVTLGSELVPGGPAKGAGRRALREIIADEAGTFGGRMAKTADLDALRRAEEMAAGGASRDDIWNETGWFNQHGNWKFEIPDNNLAITRDPLTSKQAMGRAEKAKAVELGGKDAKSFSRYSPEGREIRNAGVEAWNSVANGEPLDTLVSHPELFEAYPQASVVSGYAIPGSSSGTVGRFDPSWGWEGALGWRTSGRTKAQKTSTVGHELQHKVQNIEGFPGGSTAGVAPSFEGGQHYDAMLGHVNTIKNALADPNISEVSKIQLRRMLPKAEKDLNYAAQWEGYRRVAGEVEARNVQTRLDWTPEQRRATPPWASQDIPDEDQFVIWRSDGTAGQQDTPQGALGAYAAFDDLPATTREDLSYHIAALAGRPEDPYVAQDLTGLVDPVVTRRMSLSPSEIVSGKATSPSIVETYARMPGSTAAPLLVENVGGQWRLVEGGHRLGAALTRGDEAVDVVDVTPFRDADWDAFFDGGTNDTMPLQSLVGGSGAVADAEVPQGALGSLVATGPAPQNLDEAAAAIGMDPSLVRATPSKQAKATAKQLASMPGAPMKPITTRQVGKLSENYLNLVDLGKEGAEWYPQSGRAIMEHFGENQPRAVKFTGGVGVTSSSTPVLSNLEHAVRGNDQYIMGDPVFTGMYPNAMGKDIQKIYDGPDVGIDELVAGTGEPYGPKRTPFIRQNLMYEVNDMSTARSVRDIWDLRARGYTNKDGSTFSGTPTAAAHRWGDVQDQGYILPEANARGIGGRTDWDTGRVQAAAWVGKKIESEMAKGKTFEEARDIAITDYSHGWDRMYANHSWESAPGSNTGHMAGFDELPWDVRADYHNRAKDAFLTDDGRSRIALGYGSPAGRSYDSVGLYEGVMSPGTQDLIPVARATGSQAVDPSSAKKMDAVAATQGLLGGQKAAAWNYLSPVKAPRRPKGDGAGATGYRFDLGRTMTPEDVERYGPQVVETFGDRVGILPDPNGFRISEFWQDKDAPKLVDFVERLEKEIGTKAFPTTHTGNYIENAWDQPSGRFGGDYVGALQGLQIPDMAAKFDSFAPDIARKMVDDIDPAMMRDAGFTGSDDMERLRKTIANEGWAGLVRLVESQKGSVEAKDALLASLAGLGGAGALASVQTRD